MSYEKLPELVLIGQRVFNIYVRTVTEDTQLQDGTYGYTMTAYDNIVIRDDLSSGMLRSTLLHELMHAIRIVYRSNMTGPTPLMSKKGNPLPIDADDWEHYFIEIWEETLIIVLRDNPSVVDFLMEGLKTETEIETHSILGFQPNPPSELKED